MNQISAWLLCVFTVCSFSTGFSNNPITSQAKVFGISSKKAVNNELKPVARQVFDARASRNNFSVQQPFQVIRKKENFRSAIQQSTILQLNNSTVESMLRDRNDFIELQLEDAAGKIWALDLYRTSSVSNDFVVSTSESNGKPIFIDGGIYYRGIIKGDYNSVAAFSVFDGNIIGMISSDEGNMVLHPLEAAEEEGSFIFYNDRDLDSEMPFSCSSDQLEWSGPDQGDEDGIGSRALTDCVRVYIECDYALYLNKGSNVANVVNWITAAYNNVATLYANESINTAISEVFVWTSADPYSKTSASTALNQFRNLRTSFNGDLAHLAALGGNNLGGVAWVNSLCTSYKYAYSNISSTYQNVPTYSWTIMVMTHEMGHNLGSNHTQWCGWVGGALDNCYATEGSCAPGPPPVGGGTVMSYCHLTSNGINLNNGFGTQPGNKIRSRVSAVNCLSAECTGPGEGGGPCGTPGGLSSSNITTTTATVSWNAVSGASSYLFQYKLATSSVWSQITLMGTVANFSSLTPSTTYNCRVQAVCAGSNSEFSTILAFTTLGATCNVPAGLITSNIAINTATVSWSAVSGAISYDVQYKLATSSIWTQVNTSGTSINLTSLLAATSYNWRVRTVCASGSSSFSTFLTFTTLSSPTCNVPSGLQSSGITPTSVNLNWTSVSGATGYVVEYKLASAQNWSQQNTGSNSTTLSSLVPNSAYNWRVRTVCGSNSSANSTTQNFTTLAEPCNVPSGLSTSNITPGSVNLSWTSVSGATAYVVEYKLASAQNWSQQNTGSNSTTLSSLIPNSIYDWRVRTVCGSNSSANSITQNFTTLAEPCNTPTGLSTSNITPSSVNLSWTSVSGATAYVVEYKLASAQNWSQQNTGTNSATLNSLIPNSAYNWRVRTVCGSNTSANSTTQNFTTLAEPCNVPSGLSTTNITTSSVNLSWTSVSGATAYVVEYKLASAQNWSQQNSGSNSATLNSLIPNSAYNWRVRTVCGSNSSANSSTQNFTTLSEPCNVPTGLSTSNITTSSVNLSWTSVSGATAYVVEYKLASEQNWSQQNVGSSSATLSSLIPNSAYNWRVRTVCGSNSSANSTTQNFTTLSDPCNVPGGLSSSNITSSSVELSWTSVNGATVYIVEYKLSSAQNWSQQNVTSNSATLSSLIPNSAYDWRVRTICGSNSSVNSSTQNFTTLSETTCNTPSGLSSFNITSSSVNLSWTSVSGATAYIIEYKLSVELNWSQQNAGSNSATLSSLIPNSAYDWRVRTVCGPNSSVNSSTQNFTTLSETTCSTPTGLNSSNITSSSVDLSWTPVSGASVYIVEYKLSSAQYWSQHNVITNTAFLSSLLPNSTYNWRVKTICASGSSANSITLNFTTLGEFTCNTPTGLSSSNVTSSSVDLSWTSVSGATLYFVEYKLSGAQNWSQQNVSSNSVSLNSLMSNATYNWRVRTVCGSNLSDNSLSLNFTTLSDFTCNIPGGLSSINITSTSAQLSWASVNGATAYIVEYKLSGSQNWSQQNTSSNSAFLSSLIPNSVYNWRVQTDCGSTSSSFSGIANFTTLTEQICNPPTGLNSSNITESSVSLSWSEVNGANAYLIDYKLSSAESWTQTNSSVNSTSLSSLLSNSSYDWRVRTICGGSLSTFSLIFTFTTMGGGECATPTNLNSSNVTATTASLSWVEVNEASSYYVEYKLSHESNWNSVSTTTNSVNIAGLTPGSQYLWKVRSVCGGSTSEFSYVSSLRTSMGGGSCETPNGLSSSNVTATTATVNWNAVPGAITYNVEYKLSSANTWTLINVLGTSTTLTSLAQNSGYNVRVQAVCGGGTGSFSTILNFTTLNQVSECDSPVGLSVLNITSSSANVAWNQVPGAVSYNVEYKLASSGTWSSTNVPAANTTLTSLSPNSAYNVRVQTLCNDNSSSFSTIVNFTTLSSGSTCDVPEALNAANITTTQAQISWSAVSGALTYTLEYKLENTSLWIPVSVTGTSYILNSLTPNSTYNYRVKTVCQSSSSSFSPVLNFTTEEEQGGGALCSSSGQNADIEWISRVAIGSLNRISGSDGGYFDATSMSAGVPRGRSQTLVHKASFSGTPRTLYWRMWIDLNHDGDFDDPGELLVSKISNSNNDQFSSFAIPHTATLGPTTMRVQAKYNAYGDPCEIFANGEVEDYTIIITSLSGLPSAEEGQETNILNEIKMFPNPVGEDLNITFHAAQYLDLSIQIVDLFGRVLIQEEYHAQEGDNRLAITVSELLTGPYVLILKDGNMIKNFRFIKAE